MPAVATPAKPELPSLARRAVDPTLAMLYAVVFASVCIAVGLIWDISWHMTIGRDTLWSPPHVLEQVGASVAGIACGACVLWTTFRGDVATRQRAVRFWGFRGPFGAWVCIWGALTMIVSVPFDDWWHNAYGLDVQILSPPHSVLFAGMLAIQIGAMFAALAAQNNGVAVRRFSWLYASSAGILITMAAIAVFELIGFANQWHRSGAYVVAAVVFPIFLAAVARGGRMRWPATTAAATYMLIILAMMWVLPLFPAQPMLAPIYNAVERMVPLPFPLPLVVPALAIDLIVRRSPVRNDWIMAGVIAVAFIVLLLLAAWPLAEFLLSPGARNHLFGADQWPYTVRLGDWRYQFWDLDPGAAAFARGIGTATLIAFISARIGLAWGNWMRQVMR